VHILATSREPFRVEGERVTRLSPLPSPPASARLTATDAQVSGRSALCRARNSELGRIRVERRGRWGRRRDLPKAGRDSARDRVRRSAHRGFWDPWPRGAPGRMLTASNERPPHGRSSSPDPERHARLELSAAGRGRAKGFCAASQSSQAVSRFKPPARSPQMSPALKAKSSIRWRNWSRSRWSGRMWATPNRVCGCWTPRAPLPSTSSPRAAKPTRSLDAMRSTIETCSMQPRRTRGPPITGCRLCVRDRQRARRPGLGVFAERRLLDRRGAHCGLNTTLVSKVAAGRVSPTRRTWSRDVRIVWKNSLAPRACRSGLAGRAPHGGRSQIPASAFAVLCVGRGCPPGRAFLGRHAGSGTL